MFSSYHAMATEYISSGTLSAALINLLKDVAARLRANLADESSGEIS